jgi:hypothetical protein
VLVVSSSGIFDRIEIYEPLGDIVDDDGRRGQGSGGDGLPAADTEPDAGVPPLVELCGVSRSHGRALVLDRST